MNERNRPLPLHDVFDIVERRRRQRARVRAVAGPAAAVGAAGMAGVIVLALQTAPDQVDPAATPPGPSAALISSTPPAVQPAQPASPPPFDPDDLRPGYLSEVASGVSGLAEDADRARIGEQATAIERAWGLEFYPEAKAVAMKALTTGTPLVVDDPSGADALVNGFERAGYTEQDAAELAAAWGTDERTAKIVGVLLAQAD
ncbi:hypothetical protein [Pseudonocardia humida]|uniref:Host cell surface-exposed lipoprotein n=1 Tax=Pseudonocardia humida TaxID=2800819 RepID=A0ABT0ZZN5_9PSEU|nr:hypothetical protein [Pseudonocardia humida]MCO1656213.1 hypothetical protein [Pseudonocardia humida]